MSDYTLADEAELVWFFNDAAGEIGIPSSFGAMVARLQLGKQVKGYVDGGASEDNAERRFESCSRYRHIEETLALLSPARQRYLERAFERRTRFAQRPEHELIAACESPSTKAFLKARGEKPGVESAIIWLARAENPTPNLANGEDPKALVALRQAAWSEAALFHEAATSDYAAARRKRDQMSKADRTTLKRSS